MARRKSHIAKRLQKMRGLDSAEKHLLLRVGELVDGVINNRTPTNPFERGRTRAQKGLPPPQVITNEAGVKSAKLTWPAIDSSILNHYKITVIGLENGNEEEFISYTNSFTFKGREGGRYRALIQSVGRNGTQSVPNMIDFVVPESVMLLEGAKNTPLTIGSQVSEDIFFSPGHVIFIWGAFVIDRLIGGASTGNPEAAIRLYRAEQGKTFEESTFVEEIPLYAATESATNLEVDALGGGITRPAVSGAAASSLDFVRGTSLETCHSVMFTPFTVTEALENKNYTFFLEVVGRETPDDITGLSITLWSANAGLAAQIPADPFTVEPAIVERWTRSIRANPDSVPATQGPDWLNGNLSSNFNFIGDTYSFAVWAKWRRYGPVNNTPGILTQRWEPVVTGDSLFRLNGFRMVITRFTDVSISQNNYVSTQLLLGGARNLPSDNPANTGTWEVRDFTQRTNPNNFNSDADPPYTAPLSAIWGPLNTWTLFCFSFTPAAGVQGFAFRTGRTVTNANPFINTSVGVTGETRGPRAMVWFADPINLYGTGDNDDLDDNTALGTNYAPVRVHAAGMWNKVLTVSEFTTLYNNGNGVGINWRENTGSYRSAGNLLHYWQFGAEISDLQYIARDTGINPLGSGGNDGDIDLSVTGANPPTTQTFSVNVTLDDIVDDAPQ